MSKKNLSNSLDTVIFRCKSCHRNFECKPSKIIDDPECEWHPFKYQAHCPVCDDTCDQAHFQKNLIKAWSKATGPTTAAGKSIVQQNLKGHPNAEETRRTRFNAMKHGLNARVAKYFPSKPDGYPACRNCEIDRNFCKSQPACQQQTQLFMLHQAAFEKRDPKHLTPIYSEIQAGITAIVQQVLQTIVADGVTLRSPAWKLDKSGNVVIGEYLDHATGDMKIIYDIQAHPLLRSLQDFLSKNGMSLSDMGMTPKVIEQEEEKLGNLAVNESTQQSLLEYQQRSAAALENLASLAEKAKARRDQDPVLIEYQKQNGVGK